MTNKSFTDDESNSNDQLLQIIKYFRKEKDIAVTKVDILKSKKIIQAQDEIERYRGENENFKLTIDKQKRNKTLLKEAKTRILDLNETKNAVTRELAATKAQLQNIDQNQDDNHLKVKKDRLSISYVVSRNEKGF
ncbi:unnamed protein product [Hermetia illucens]|uniref:Uncharacterized protein n=1 Tax=Hermetia illucens TaxID=343691 RepID=A0A7R8YQD2_HERIL|nr:unnamed protein product [Hermetia illucens]